MAALLAAGYAICLGPLGFIPTIAYVPAAVGCTDCPDNLLGFVTFDELVIASTRIGFLLQAAWVVALAIALSVRLLDRRGFDRRLAVAIQLPVVVAIGATAADAVHSIPRGSLSNDQLDVALWVVSAIGLIAWRSARCCRSSGREPPGDPWFVLGWRSRRPRRSVRSNADLRESSTIRR